MKTLNKQLSSANRGRCHFARDVDSSHWLNGGHSAKFCARQMQSQPDKNIGSAKNLKVCAFIRIYFLYGIYG